MVKLTQSLEHWLFENHKEKLPLIMLGHVELFTAEMEQEYFAWCLTEDGNQYLKGGSKYVEEDPAFWNRTDFDPEPVKHGRWEWEHETWGQLQCSVCKKEALLEKANGDIGMILLYVTSNYCPNCGAKMDLGAEA